MHGIASRKSGFRAASTPKMCARWLLCFGLKENIFLSTIVRPACWGNGLSAIKAGEVMGCSHRRFLPFWLHFSPALTRKQANEYLSYLHLELHHSGTRNQHFRIRAYLEQALVLDHFSVFIHQRCLQLCGFAELPHHRGFDKRSLPLGLTAQ